MQYISKPAYKAAKHVGIINGHNLRAYAGPLAFWGVATVFTIGVYTEAWPRFRSAFYKKIPVLGKHWQKVTDPEDVPV